MSGAGCEISEKGGMSTDRIPDVRHLEKMECRPDRISDVRHPEKVGCRWTEIPDVRHPEKGGTSAGQNSGCETSGECGMSAD